MVCGPDLNELNGDSHYARIALLRVGDIESDDEDDTEQAFRAIQDMDFREVPCVPQGLYDPHQLGIQPGTGAYQPGGGAEGHERSAASARTLSGSISSNRNILAVKLLFITAPDADYAALTRDAKTVKDITMSLTKILEGMPTDCGSCNLKAICDEVEGMRELHFGKEHHTTE